MHTLNKHDLQWALQLAPKQVLEAMKSAPCRVFVAGGFIRSSVCREPVNDIDMFVSTEADAGALAMNLAENDPKRIYRTDNALTVKGYRIPIQIIHRWLFETPERCAQSFDFTIAMSSVWWSGEAWESLCHPDFYSDLAAKRLVYTSPDRNEDAGGSLLRVLKFYQRGYRIPLGSMGAVIARLLRGVDEINWEKRNTMDTQAWELQMGHVLTGLLREVDPAIDPNHLAHLPDLQAA